MSNPLASDAAFHTISPHRSTVFANSPGPRSARSRTASGEYFRATTHAPFCSANSSTSLASGDVVLVTRVLVVLVRLATTPPTRGARALVDAIIPGAVARDVDMRRAAVRRRARDVRSVGRRFVPASRLLVAGVVVDPRACGAAPRSNHAIDVTREESEKPLLRIKYARRRRRGRGDDDARDDETRRASRPWWIVSTRVVLRSFRVVRASRAARGGAAARRGAATSGSERGDDATNHEMVLCVDGSS
tara:strand:- start:30296 stop:31036 length:741 start_codon:yes stop_codon:yes gene_type:complete